MRANRSCSTRSRSRLRHRAIHPVASLFDTLPPSLASSRTAVPQPGAVRTTRTPTKKSPGIAIPGGSLKDREHPKRIPPEQDMGKSDPSDSDRAWQPVAKVPNCGKTPAFFFSKQQMNQVIQPPPEDHSPPGKPHHLADGRPITRVVTMCWAMFACGLGIHRAMRSLDECVGQ